MMNIPAIYLQLLICLPYSHVWKENENDYLDNPIYEHFSLEPKYYESATVYMSLTHERPQPTPKYNLLEREYIIQALQDAAFMLRGHKFFEYDRRVYRGEVRNLSAKLLYRQFPIPPLRRLHQKIRHVCGVSLFDCVTYLQKVAHHTQFVRQDFPGTLTFNEFKNITINETLLKAADKECVLRRHSDYVHAFPFREPLERFQWRASASYFMCFFAMAQLDEIEKFHEPCDNFGGCIDPVFGIHNKDVRANDSAPFSCATYSFCPDPCCARYLKSYEDCWEDTSNPCYDIALPGARQCKVNPEENHNFNAMVKNHWNITCNCPDEGYKFKSVFGFCVDINECLLGSHSCDNETQTCFNQPGGFVCGCRWGYFFDNITRMCLQHDFLVPKIVEEPTTTPLPLVQRVYNFMHPKCLLRHKEAQANWSRKFESDDFTA